jgi:hypothetical protein
VANYYRRALLKKIVSSGNLSPDILLTFEVIIHSRLFSQPVSVIDP